MKKERSWGKKKLTDINMDKIAENWKPYIHQSCTCKMMICSLFLDYWVNK